MDIGDASAEEVRWWAAILALDQGWQATMTLERDHGLRCLGLSRNYVNGKVESKPVNNAETFTASGRSPMHRPSDVTEVPIYCGEYSGLATLPGICST